MLRGYLAEKMPSHRTSARIHGNDWLNQATFVCGHRKSGTTLMVALLDNHPELVVYPDDSKFFHRFFPVRAFDETLTVKENIESIVEVNLAYLKSVLVNGCAVSEGSELVDKIAEVFRSRGLNSDGTWPALLKSLIAACAKCTKEANESPLRWVEKTTSSEIFAPQIADAFPEAKFIHVVRDPRDNYASLKAGFDKRYRFMPDTPTLQALRQSCIDRGRLGLEAGLMNQSVLGVSRYLFVKFEDLISRPESIMEDVCAFLGINPDELDYRPTVFGRPWPGNNEQGLIFDAVDASRAASWKERITPHEAALMEFHFFEMLQRFGYATEYSARERSAAASSQYMFQNFKISAI